MLKRSPNFLTTGLLADLGRGMGYGVTGRLEEIGKGGTDVDT